MNQKCSNLIEYHGSNLNSNRLNMTIASMNGNRSLLFSQFSTRQKLESRDSHNPFQQKRFNLYSPVPIYSGESMTQENSKTPTRDLIVKKVQKYKYTMDKMKLSLNKTTFMKFYDLKRKLEDNSSLTAVATPIKAKLWKPQVREEATIEMISGPKGKPTGFLINGFNGDVIKQIVKFDVILNSSVNSRKFKPMIDWKAIVPKNHE